MRKLYAGMGAVAIATALFIGTLVTMPEQEAESKGYKVITLSEKNSINLNTQIDGPMASGIQAQLISKDNNLPKGQPLYIVLNSPGGSIVAGNSIIETAKGLGRPVHTISIFSASMSFMISQYLDKRYVVDSGTLMSHRAAAGGMGGQVPGNLITRVDSLLEDIRKLEMPVAERAGYSLPDYEAMVADELWMNSDKAIKLRFADETVRVRCDSSLDGPGDEKEITIFVFTVKVTFHKCPLVAYPLSVKFSDDVTDEWQKYILTMLRNRSQFVRYYGPVLVK